MKHSQGYTLIELLIGFMVAAIMIITVGTIVNIGNASYRDLSNNGQIFTDVAHGFKFMRHQVRESESFLKDTPGYSPWKAERLLVGLGAFGILQADGKEEFVYLPDQADPTQKTVFVSLPVTHGDGLDFSIEDLNPKGVVVNLTWTRNGNTFQMETTVGKRMDE